ncbi:unnamed protein product [Rotaria magnacalcarata]|uniref:Mitochondrial import receptor subunit TOM20-like protein n=2 Tax=Rotaria magnacalcarata TaxID=392030 RepID=A0A819F9K7_9BILA|nr:unnamed protein product [Rotaria magnacalcarata]CAF1504525.1 unnamed protein product [Rotaria magnacalcarata]CAF2062367.1 unnamed protein product [Rotaria magnacalcarata]CAF2077701.1 unnamed protein product [Rotaria magnacalcarata]CAF3808764.1 unnamed protein product [Rotaria magnacalcarata]
MLTTNIRFWPLVAAVGVSFIGYCVYFDRKRRNAPDFHEKLKAKRQKQKQKPQQTGGTSSFNKINDAEEMRHYFLEQIQLGEDCLTRGDIDTGLNCLAKAVLACSQPQNLMVFFQQSLPSELFQELITRIPKIAQSMEDSAAFSAALGSGSLPEVDLE